MNYYEFSKWSIQICKNQRKEILHRGPWNLHKLNPTNISLLHYSSESLSIHLTPSLCSNFCAKSLAFFIRPEAEQFAGARVSGRRGARRRQRMGGGAPRDHSEPTGLFYMARIGLGRPGHDSGELGHSSAMAASAHDRQCNGEAKRRWR